MAAVKDVRNDRREAIAAIRSERVASAKATGVPFSTVVYAKPTQSSVDYSPTGGARVRENHYH